MSSTIFPTILRHRRSSGKTIPYQLPTPPSAATGPKHVYSANAPIFSDIPVHHYRTLRSLPPGSHTGTSTYLVHYHLPMPILTSSRVLTNLLVGQKPSPFLPSLPSPSPNHSLNTGLPDSAFPDRGRQFESTVPSSLRSLTSLEPPVSEQRPTILLPMVLFKASLKATNDPSHWSERLQLFLLGIRSAVKTNLDPTSYVDRLRRIFQDLHPPPTRSRKRTAHVPTDLQTCTHVFVRRDAVRKTFATFL